MTDYTLSVKRLADELAVNRFAVMGLNDMSATGDQQMYRDAEYMLRRILPPGMTVGLLHQALAESICTQPCTCRICRTIMHLLSLLSPEEAK